MADNGTPISTYNVDNLQETLVKWYTDTGTEKVPLKALFECLPNNDYTNDEFKIIESSLDIIINHSILFESKRIYSQAVSLKEQLNLVKCVGSDSTFLFAGFIENCKYFIEYYESVKNKAVLETDVNQNPNYYNN